MNDTATSGGLQVCEHKIWRVRDEMSETAFCLLGLIARFEGGRRGSCVAKGRTLAERLGVSERTVRRRVSELASLGLIVAGRRRMLWTERRLTSLGWAVLDAAGGPLFGRSVAGPNGATNPSSGEIRETRAGVVRAATPPEGPVDPDAYRPGRAGLRLSRAAWSSVAAWLRSAATVSWARCKIAHRAFAGLSEAVERSREFRSLSRGLKSSRGVEVTGEDLVRLAVDDAVACGRGFGTVESAMAYVSAVVLACVRERRLPGEVCR